MSIQTNSPSTNLGTSVSADEIAVLLGFANAAAMVAASVQYVLATGGTTNYVASPALALTPVNGTSIAVRFPSNCAASATLNVSGSGAKGIRVRTVAGTRLTEASDILSDTTYIFTYTEDGGGFWVATGGAHLKAADIPPTLNATTFGGYITATGTYGVVSSSGSSYTYFCGGTNPGQINGAYMSMQSVGFSTGDLLLYPSNLTGSCVRLYDKNGAERARADANGISALSPVVSVGTSFTTICAVAGNQALIVATVTGAGSILLEWDGSTLTKLAGVSTLVVAGSAGAGETAFRVSGGNLQAIVDTGTRNVSSGFSVRH